MAQTTRPTSRGQGSVRIGPVQDGESVRGYVRRVTGGDDRTLYKQILGAANPFKEGDHAIWVAAADDDSRRRARALVSQTRIRELEEHPIFEDSVSRLIRSTTDRAVYASICGWTIGELRRFLLDADEAAIKAILPGLPSDAIGALVRILTNDELVLLGQRLFHPLPGRSLGARGYFGARIQPNSPTDHVDDILWQVFCAFSYAVGDFLIGTNPVDSTPESVARVELALHDLVTTFQLEETLPHCVLAHIDVQAEVEKMHPGKTGIWFQSLAGCESANQTFGISVDQMMQYAAGRTGRYGLYLETGQGADFTNGHGHGFDMVLHESRKYGFVRALKQQVAAAREPGDGPWIHVNDVAGFIGPEVFRTKEQLVRACLEDIAMGKLHGLTIGLDVCSTLHMSITPDDLDWCVDQIMPANPAYLMALPTKNDPMLSYLTTSFQDHVRIRERFGFRVDDRMWSFFRQLGVIDDEDQPTDHFGDPVHVYVRYRRLRGDDRPDDPIRAEGLAKMQAVKDRGVPIASGHGDRYWDLRPDLQAQLQQRYVDSKECLWATLTDGFRASVRGALPIASLAADRDDYIAHPTRGEDVSAESRATLTAMRAGFPGPLPDVVVVISDGLNAHAIQDDGHALVFLDALRGELAAESIGITAGVPILKNGRVRAGYRIGELLFGVDDAPTGPNAPRHHALLHVIGERPGSGHHNFSVYLTVAAVAGWTRGSVDHDRTQVVSGISDTALNPAQAARQVVGLLRAKLQS